MSLTLLLSSHVHSVPGHLYGGDMNLPAIEITATGDIVHTDAESSRLTLSMNLKNIALTQYGHYNFVSFETLNGTPIGSSEIGLYSLDDSQTDGVYPIEAQIETPTIDMGTPVRFRKGYLAGEVTGELKMTVKVNDDVEEEYTITPASFSNKENRTRFEMHRSQKGTCIMFKINNIGGSDFSIDSLKVLPIALTQGRL